MCIYCGTNKYRKIFEHHNGPIPKDNSGRSYHIHHIDGDRNNNQPNNLKAVSIVEHFQIHVEQEDWGACLRLAPLLNMSATEISAIASKANQSRLCKGTHIFQSDIFKAQLPEWSRAVARRRVAEGTNPFQDKKKSQEWAAQRVASGVYQTPQYSQKCTERNLKGIHDGTNPFSPDKNPSKIQTQCPHCHKTGGISNMRRWHFDKCMQSPNYVKSIQKFDAVVCPHCKVVCTNYQSVAYHFDKCASAPGYTERKRAPNKIVKCPHCGTKGATAQMKRWHFNKCKSFKDADQDPQIG